MNSFLKRNAMAITGVSICSFVIAIALFLTNSTAAASTRAADAAATYKSKCAGCHGADGKGETPAGKKLGVKDFREFQGDRYPILAHGKGKMPAYEKSLGADTCKALVDYIQNTFK